MAALEKYIITATEIRTFRPTAVLDDEVIKPYILEAQRLDLAPVLNDALYYAFVADFNQNTGVNATTKYEELRSGKTYTYQSNTIQFDGVKPMLAYFALARFCSANPTQITRYGLVQKTATNSTPVDAQAVRAMVNELRSAAIGYQYQVVKFLEQNPTDYPLYNTGGASDQSARNTSFNFFKA